MKTKEEVEAVPDFSRHFELGHLVQLELVLEWFLIDEPKKSHNGKREG